MSNAVKCSEKEISTAPKNVVQKDKAAAGHVNLNIMTKS
jgi:hypothetical protein